MTTALSPFLSSKFRFWTFVSMFMLVFVHGYNLQIRYLQPWTLPGEPLTVTGFTEYFLANGIFRFWVPMLFIISGYLFAMTDDRTYKSRTWKRFLTLIVPYLVWSALGLAFTWLLEMIPFGRDIVAGSHVAQVGDARLLVHDYRWYEVLGRWLLVPVPYQLWFLRVLFIYNLAYPAIRWCVLHRIARWIFFPVVILMWLGHFDFLLVEGEGLLFFSFGVWVQKTGFNMDSPGNMRNPLWWGVAFITLAAAKTFLAFSGAAFLGGGMYPVFLLLHKGTVLAGLVACWYGLDSLVRRCMDRRWFAWLTAFSFLVYAMHTPLIAYAIDPFLAWLAPLPLARLVTFILLPLSIFALCILTGVILRKALPRVYGVLTGGRGQSAGN